jgi:ribosome-associated toxin RatA of RatAB toxin-antitoxin module
MAKVCTDKNMQVSPQDKYPEFLKEVVKAQVLPGATSEKIRVKFELEVVKRFDYTLEFTVEGKERVQWKLVDSNFFKQNEGSWYLKPAGDKETSVHYELEVSFGFLVPSWISKKLTEVNLPKMFENFEIQAKKYD